MDGFFLKVEISAHAITARLQIRSELNRHLRSTLFDALCSAVTVAVAEYVCCCARKRFYGNLKS